MTPEEVMRAATDAWNENGIEGFLEHAARDLVWHAPPEYMEGQEWHGREAVAQSWNEQFDAVFEQARSDFEAFETGANAHLATLRGHARARGSGIDLDWRAYFVALIDEDLITELWVFNHEDEARRQAGLDAE
jgi:ketosteroid isomerase-like protein